MERFKFGRLMPDGTDVAHRYPNVYEWAATTGPMRLVIAPGMGHVELMLELSKCWFGPYWVLYVLSIPRGDALPGRYQAPAPMERPELEALFAEYGAFFEGDGRHAVWIASARGEGTVVFDRHNVLYAYGPIEAYEDVLNAREIQRGEVDLPVPHSHHYHAEHDVDEGRLLNALEWIYSPLRDQDED